MTYGTPQRRIVEIGNEEDGRYFGGSLRHPWPSHVDGDPADQALAELDARVAELEAGVSRHALDVEPVPDAPVEVLAYFDVGTGEHVAVWRILCRQV